MTHSVVKMSRFGTAVHFLLLARLAFADCWALPDPSPDQLKMPIPKEAVFLRNRSFMPDAAFAFREPIEEIVKFYQVKGIALKNQQGKIFKAPYFEPYPIDKSPRYFSVEDISAKKWARKEDWKTLLTVSVSELEHLFSDGRSKDDPYFQAVERIVLGEQNVWFVGVEEPYRKSSHVRYDREKGEFVVESSLPDTIKSPNTSQAQQSEQLLTWSRRRQPVLRISDEFQFKLQDPDRPWLGYVLLDMAGKAYRLPSINQSEIEKWYEYACYGVGMDDDLSAKKSELLDLWKKGEMENSGGPFLVHDGIIWMGLQGGFSEGYGSFGGLASFNMKERKWNIIRHPLLVVSQVSAIAVEGTRLWLGTVMGHEGSSSSLSGLVTYDLVTRTWKHFTRLNSQIVGNVIDAIAKDGDFIWIATTNGISRLNPRTLEWRSLKWVFEGNKLARVQPIDLELRGQ